MSMATDDLVDWAWLMALRLVADVIHSDLPCPTAVRHTLEMLEEPSCDDVQHDINLVAAALRYVDETAERRGVMNTLNEVIEMTEMN